ncbi:CBS domain-containing protein [Gracilibacillus salitolerans]|uniref:CBS domain-containing protein n=1 Tax=Gracilibacillus salitolerans TaxID=2663022 RepID=A0A5Q2TS59_9BACI|nr:CBS domain-containing protein [Gracilibacillus salitolerans]QGH36510.1 CBS domain-containing protein [Gracilibacillus salitolerans]
MKTVRDIMEQNVSFCKADDSLRDAAELMKQRNVGAIPVCGDNKELLGMVTDRDLVIRGYADNKDGSAKVQEVMSDHLYHVSPDISLQEASQTMAEHQIRRLPVVTNGQLTGIISLGDLSLDEMSDEAAGQALEDISEQTELQ